MKPTDKLRLIADKLASRQQEEAAQKMLALVDRIESEEGKPKGFARFSAE